MWCGEQFSPIKVVDVDKTNAIKWEVVEFITTNDTSPILSLPLSLSVSLSLSYSTNWTLSIRYSYLALPKIDSEPLKPTTTCNSSNLKFKWNYLLRWVFGVFWQANAFSLNCSILTFWKWTIKGFSFIFFYLFINRIKPINKWTHQNGWQMKVYGSSWIAIAAK